LPRRDGHREPGGAGADDQQLAHALAHGRSSRATPGMRSTKSGP
jgi:hypothetical protein